MDSMASMSPSPLVKAEEFGMDDDVFPLFSAESSVDPTALAMSPDNQYTNDPTSPAPEGADVDGDKKPTKKRKSWGQVLPEPKTNLPPRKRAKTEDEKEQRRVERVLRNRRAAQSSRERKRQETELLAKRNKELEAELAAMHQRYQELERELKKARPELGGVSSTNDTVTLSRPLFGLMGAMNTDAFMNLSGKEAVSTTIDPASISPAPSPAPEEQVEEGLETIAEEPELHLASEKPQQEQAASRVTQYPAAILCDLLCPRESTTTPCLGAFSSWVQFLVLAYHVWTSPVILPTILKASSPSSKPRPLPQPILISILNTVMISTSTNSTLRTTGSSTSTSRSMTAQSASSGSSNKTLRLRTLRKLLTSNRDLARPLQDATLELMRLRQSRGAESGIFAQARAGQPIAATPDMQIDCETLPSTERLMSLWFAIQTLDRRIENKQRRTAAVGAKIPGTSATSGLTVRKRSRFDFSKHGTISGSQRESDTT